MTKRIIISTRVALKEKTNQTKRNKSNKTKQIKQNRKQKQTLPRTNLAKNFLFFKVFLSRKVLQ